MIKIIFLPVSSLKFSSQILNKIFQAAKTNILNRIILIITFLCLFQYSFSQYNWEKINLPDSIEVFTMYFDENYIYLGSSEGVFLSEDNLQSINYIGLGEFGISQILKTDDNKITVFASNGNVCKYLGNNSWDIYQGLPLRATSAAESNEGYLFYGAWGKIYKSTDYGISWDTVWSTTITEVVNVIVENFDGALFAGTRSYFSSDPGGVYRSDDEGETWNLVGLESYGISSLAVNSNNVLFSSVYGAAAGGVYKSLDSLGLDWENIYYENRLINDLKINQYNTIVIGCTLEGFPGGVYYSYDSGEIWEDISGDLPSRHINRIFISPDNYIYILNSQTDLLYKLTNPITYNIENLNVHTLIVYPNPIKKKLRFSLSVGGLFDIRINDLNGREVLYCESEIKPNQTEIINISNIHSGIYFVTINNNKYYYSTKFIKN